MKRPRQYALFARERGTRNWVRVTPFCSAVKDVAVRIFQDKLLASAMGMIPDDTREYRLRPVE